MPDSDSGSDSNDESEFLEAFPTYHLHRKARSYGNLYVFDSQDAGGGSQNNSSSADRQTTGTIQDKIKSALNSLSILRIDVVEELTILQFWAPVEIGGRHLLSTSGQLFAVKYPDNDLIKYRQRSTEYLYDIDVNYRPQEDGEEDEESNPKIITSGPPATAFLNRLPRKVDISKDTRGTLTQYALELDLVNSIMLPICCPSQTSSTCVGVIEFSSIDSLYYCYDLQEIYKALKEAGLSIFDVQERIPYKTLHGLESVRDQITDAIQQIVCESHKQIFAQVWIAYHEDKNQVPFLSSFEYAQKKHMLALKLTGYYNDDFNSPYNRYRYDYYLRSYCDLCDMVPLDTGKSLVEQTLQDSKSRFYKTPDRLNKNLMSPLTKVNGIVICLRSIATGDFCYVFEFFCIDNSDYDFSLEDLLLALKGHLPSFKFASGAELGDELQVVEVDNSTECDIRSLKIFEGKGKSSMPKAPEEGKNLVAPPKRKHKTAPKDLPQKRIEQEFGKTMKAAADNLKVSVSTLKRKCKEYGIYEWKGPRNPGKKKVNHFRNQSGTIEEDTGAILVPYALERNEKNLTIKAEDSNGSNDMIRFELPMSEVTFKSVENEIVKEFELIPGTYKIKYCDKEEDWILLTPNYDMNYCIRSSKDSHKNIIRLRIERVSPSA